MRHQLSLHAESREKNVQHLRSRKRTDAGRRDAGACPRPPRTRRVAAARHGRCRFHTTTKALGPLKIENQNTTGYDSTAAFAITQATGSCKNGGASIMTQEYLSNLNRPAVTSCPIRRAPVPASANDVVQPRTSGGCQPTMTMHNSGPAIPQNKLALYTLVQMSAAGATPAPAASGSPAPSGIGFLTERGNLKTLGAPDVSLFSIPNDFTKTP